MDTEDSIVEPPSTPESTSEKIQDILQSCGEKELRALLNTLNNTQSSATGQLKRAAVEENTAEGVEKLVSKRICFDDMWKENDNQKITLPHEWEELSEKIDKKMKDTYREFVAIIVETGLQVDYKNAKPIARYKSDTSKQQRPDEVPVGQIHEVCSVGQWTVSKEMAERLDKKRDKAGAALTSFFAAMSKSRKECDVILFQHSDTDLHYHGLLCFKSSMTRDMQIIRALGERRIREGQLTVKKRSCNNPGWWLLHVAESRKGSIYMGSSSETIHNIYRPIYGKVKEIMEDGGVPSIPEPPLHNHEIEGISCDNPEMDGFLLMSGTDPFQRQIQVSRKMLANSKATEYKINMLCQIFKQIFLQDYMISELTEYKDRISQEAFRILTHMSLYQEKLFCMAQDRYFKGLIQMPLEEVCYLYTDAEPIHFEEVSYYLSGGPEPQAPYHILLWWLFTCIERCHPKKRCLYIWEPQGDKGKTQWLSSALHWIAPMFIIKITTSDHRFEDLHRPHRLVVIDDENSVICDGLLGDMKHIFAGTRFQVNVKHKSSRWGRSAPVIFLNNMRDLCVSPVVHLPMFHNRMHKVQLGSNHSLPYITNEKAQEIFMRWSALCFTRCKRPYDYVMPDPNFVEMLHDRKGFDMFASKCCRTAGSTEFEASAGKDLFAWIKTPKVCETSDDSD